MEVLHNKVFEFNNMKIKANIEYYDYSKSKNSIIQELNNPSAKPKRDYNSNYSGNNNFNNNNNKFQNQNRKNNFNNQPYNKIQNQNNAFSNQKFDNVKVYKN